MTVNGKSIEYINKVMIEFLPELESSYATYPMRYPKWLSPQETAANGEPCFIKSDQDAGMKMDYVWGPGPYGFGYYHLLTKASYIHMFNKIQSSAPTDCLGCMACGKAARKAYDDWDDIKRIIDNRHVSPVPDDQIGKEAAIDAAKLVANAHYTYDQTGRTTHGVAASYMSPGVLIGLGGEE